MTPEEEAPLTPGTPILVQGYVDEHHEATRLAARELTAVESAGPEGIYAKVQGEIRRIPAHLVAVAQLMPRPVRIGSSEVVLERVRLFYAASNGEVRRIT